MPSLYERAASNGGFLGLYLTLLFFANAYTQAFTLLALVGLILMIGVPVIVYIFLSRSYRVSEYKATFSELWLEGISTFFFATLIVSLIAVVFMMWLQPDWLYDQVQLAIDQGKESGMPELEEMADLLSSALQQRALPSPIQLCIDMGWLIVFSGSLLSMGLAAVVRSCKRD